MIRSLSLAAFVAAVFLIGAPSAEAPAVPTRAEVVRQVLVSSVRVQVLSGEDVKRSASGVVVASRGGRSTIMTNAHVIDPKGLKDVSYRVLLERRGRVERTLPARLSALGEVPDTDLGLLEVDTALPPVEVAREDQIDVGDEVVVVGAPYGRSLSVSGGMVSQLEAVDGDASEPLRFTAMKTDASIGYGSSGGGVFAVPSGRLIGIVEGYRTARVAINDRQSFDVPMPGETFVAPVTKLRSFLAAHMPVNPTTRTASLESDSAKAPAKKTTSAVR